MNDSASGSISGFLFQFEKALLMLTELKKSDEFISVENVDDIAKHGGNSEIDKILYTVQAKHSLIASSSPFNDTSKALWRTLEIWVQKLDENVFDDQVKFVCCTNVIVPKDALLRKFDTEEFGQVIELVKELLFDLEQKIQLKAAENKSAPHLSEIVKKIKIVLKKENHFKTICENLIIDDEGEIEAKFSEALRLNVSGITKSRQIEILQTFYGWLISTCFAKWRNGEMANISKSMFDSKLLSINSSPQILYATFRKKEALGTLSPEKKDYVKDEIFVKQINDIQRGPGKKIFLEKALNDFLHHEIEISYVIEQGEFTGDDFDLFRQKCQERWSELFYQHVIEDGYSEEERNALAIKIYDSIMNENLIKFNGGFEFDLENRYIKNGSFLALSNKPVIGWRPDWEEKYKKNG
ncbi:ABC-three component system protein [Pedobacter psychrotolerans]|uniref:ABC-three component system protein n=1 Tax=Pedobacter psychrotolerans TaxID=1843235 RepID=UPI003F9DDBF5